VSQCEVDYNGSKDAFAQSHSEAQEEVDIVIPNETQPAMSVPNKAVATSEPVKQVPAIPLGAWQEGTRLIEGEVVFHLPAPQSLSEESLEDLEYWLEGVMKK